jgi:hypothetical protein
MSSSSRHNLPFPTNFLSLNTPPVKRTNSITTPLTPPEASEHSFLSNNPSSVRKSSMSSTASSEPPSSPTNTVVRDTVPVPGTFLPLNSKYTPPQPKITQVPTSGFLSNVERRGSV